MILGKHGVLHSFWDRAFGGAGYPRSPGSNGMFGLGENREKIRSSSCLEAKMYLTYSDIGIYCLYMARAATSSDAFNAVAEPRRREILNYLALEERPVGDIVAGLGMEQPSVSKHLKVLREVGLVRVRRNGRHMLYRTNAEGIRPLHEWSKTFERFWQHQLSRVRERAEAKIKGLEKE